MEQPQEKLKPLPPDKKTLADLLENANENYKTYYLLLNRYKEWQEWYNKQKQIYEDVK